jgi:hypothetical protein
VLLGEVVIVPVPPIVVSIALVVPPLHAIGFADAVIVIAGDCVIIIEVVFVQPFASVAVNVYVPADKLVLLGEVVIVPVPPLVVSVALVVPPLQAIGFADAEIVIVGDCVMVIEVVFVQPFASVAVKV